MYNIYYISSSASVTSSVTVVPDYSFINTPPSIVNPDKPFLVYQNAVLHISASAYESSGSTYTSTIGTLRAYIISASAIQVSFPLEQINIFYNQQYPGNQYAIAPIDEPDLSLSPTTPILYSYISNTGSLTPTSFFFKIFDSASSPIINTSESYEYGIITFRTGSTYVAVMTGSGDYYTLGLALYNNSTSTYDFSTSSFNTPISYSFSISNNTDSRTFFASSSLPTGFSLLFDGPGDIPYTANELNLWNSTLGISASSVVINGATASLFGGNLDTFTGSLNIASLGAVNDIIPYSLLITSCSFNGNSSTSTTPPKVNLSSPSLYNLKYFDITNLGSGAVTSGSFPSPSGSGIITYKCGSNFNLVTRIDTMNLSSASALSYFDSSNNNVMTGGTPNLSLYNLITYFYCNGGSLNGGIGSLSGCYSLREFNCYNNLLTGSIPSLSNNYNLEYFNCSLNNLSGSIPSLTNNTNLTTFYCNNNIGITGSIPTLPTSIVNFNSTSTGIIAPLPNLDNNTNLYLFAASICKISGSIPSLTNNTKLYYFNVGNNHLTGSIPSLTNNTSLYYFNVATNKLSGSIPSLNNNRSLNQFYVHNNYLTSYTSSGVSSTIQYFWAYNNLLDQTSVDGILYDLDRAGGRNGDVQLQGGSNSAPSALGYTYTASLVSKGWSVSVN